MRLTGTRDNQSNTRHSVSLAPVIAACVLWLCGGSFAQAPPGLPTEAAKVRAPLSTSPITTLSEFVENTGQWRDDVVFFGREGREGGIEALVRRDGLLLAPPVPHSDDALATAPLALRLPREAEAVRGLGEIPTLHHFFTGPASRHRAVVLGYERVVFEGVASGVDLVVRRVVTGFAYDLHAAPGAEIGSLVLTFAVCAAQRGKSVIGLKGATLTSRFNRIASHEMRCSASSYSQSPNPCICGVAADHLPGEFPNQLHRERLCSDSEP